MELPLRDINELSSFYNKVFVWKLRTIADSSVPVDE